MYNIEIRGNNLQELYANAVNLVVLLARGGNTVMTPNAPTVPDTVNETPVVKSDPLPVDPTPQTTAAVMEPVAEPQKRKPGRPRAPQTIEATATEVVETKPDTDGIPDFLDANKKTEAPTAQLDLDKDIRPRIREINAAQLARLMDAGAKESAAAIAAVEHIKKLFAEFSLAKAAHLPVTKYAEFMARSQAYLDGTA